MGFVQGGPSVERTVPRFIQWHHSHLPTEDGPTQNLVPIRIKPRRHLVQRPRLFKALGLAQVTPVAHHQVLTQAMAFFFTAMWPSTIVFTPELMTL
jgi:hypothetical protein